jgi:DNA-binding response OmpR family regulator
MLYEFEDYCLDVARQELRRGADLVAVEPQVLDLLHYLICNRERVVSKDDLIAHVWNGRLVSDSALTSRIATARQAVGDSGHHQRLIARSRVRAFASSVRFESVSTGIRPVQQSKLCRWLCRFRIGRLSQFSHSPI